MTRRDVVIDALKFRNVPYVPWAWSMTIGCAARLREYLGTAHLEDFEESHFCDASANPPWTDLGNDNVRDSYGVVWDQTVDKDIGTPIDWPIKVPRDLINYRWPDISDEKLYAPIQETIAASKDRFIRFNLGFSLFERAWTMFGMENLLIAMVEEPRFVEDFLDAIVEHNLVMIRRALDLGIDMMHFGDDYGMQTGLIMGIGHWRHYIKPRLARMFAPAIEAGKFVSIHSCGCVAELFDDLVEVGLNMFNPFQPEVMDVFGLMKKYHGRLAFHGGMSIQKVLPFGTVQEVRQMARKLIDAGRSGGYIFSPSHQVPRDVPPRNLVAMMEVLKGQSGYPEPVS